MNLLLKNLEGKDNRTARFRTVITLVTQEGIRQFEGEVHGKIIDQKRGTEGFGYDPIFVPTGYQHTFAEMDLKEKNGLSHRAKAIQKMVEFFENRVR